jgi:hypothetical protein
VCLAGAGYLTAGLWLDPGHRVVAHNPGDQALFEWLLGYAAYAPLHGADPWYTTLLNHPLGANLAVNTSMVLAGALLAPVTLTLGAPVSFLVLLTASLAATPYAWYHVLSRYVVRNRAAAVVGGLWCGWAPGMVSHANGHLNFVAQFLLPFLVAGVLRLREGGAVRRGAVLGLLVAAAFTLGAEVLFFAAVAGVVCAVAWAVTDRTAARAAAGPVLRGLGVAAAVTGVLLAYPLYLQFAGPQRYHGTGFNQLVQSADLASFGAVPYLSLGRLAGLWVPLSPHVAEESGYLGPTMLLFLAACVVVLRRNRVARAVSITAAAVAVLALGPWLHVGGRLTGPELPYAALARLPLFDAALPDRFGLMLVPASGVLLALAWDRVGPLPWRQRRWWAIGLAAALLPVVPLTIPAAHRDPVPHFFSSGRWHQYVHSGQTLVPVPPASDRLPDGQRWQVAANFGFAIPSGFFLGPGPHGRSHIGPWPRRPTDQLLTDVARYGTPAIVTDADRDQARRDLAYWHAVVVVLDPGHSPDVLRQTATELFGPPTRVDDVWLWQVG